MLVHYVYVSSVVKPGGGVFRAYDAIKSVSERAQLKLPSLIRTTNMRKYMATMLQVNPQYYSSYFSLIVQSVCPFSKTGSFIVV